MRPRIVALAALVAAAQMAAARNVIREWGAHNPPEFLIVQNAEFDDIAVVIQSNAHPTEAWKFEAYEDSDPNQPPGYINYIEIADGVTVGDIHLSVIGDLSHVPAHPHGAAQLKAFDLSRNGTSTNKLEELDITGDLGELGPMKVPSAGTLAIGGVVWSPIDIGYSITGPVTITEVLADIGCETMQDLTIVGPSRAGYPLPSISVRGSYTAPYKMDIYSNLDRLEVGNEMSAEVYVSLSVEHLKLLGLSGSVQVHHNVDWLEVSYVTSDGFAQVDGQIGLLNVYNYVDGTIKTGGDLQSAELWGPISETGLIDVGNDLGGAPLEQALYIPAGLGGTVRVRNDLLAQGFGYVYIGYFVAPGRLQVDRDEYGLIRALGGVYDVALPVGTSITVGRDFYGAIEVGEADGTISVGDQVGSALIHVFDDLTGSVHSDNDLAHVDIDGAVSENASITAGQYLLGPLSVLEDMAGTISATEVVAAPITIGGNVSGQISSDHELWSVIVVEGSMEPGAAVTAGAPGILDADFTGSLDVDGHVAGNLEAGHDWSGALNIGGTLSGRLHAGNDLLAEVSVGAMGTSAVVEVTGNLGNHFYSADGMGGSFTVGGNLESTIEGRGMTADLWIKGNLTEAAAVLISCASVPCCTPGTIRIDGDMSGTIDIPVLCDQAGDLSQGHIIVNGSFAEGGEIHLWGHLTGTAFFACDYDGWDDSDDWNPNAVVIIYDPFTHYYYENTPEQHLLHITECKGDLSGDGAVNFGDINPFILALSDPAGYALAFPGLDGSRVYHGDANCDQAFNFGDINTFVLLVEYHCCMGSDCEPCWDDDDGEPLGPEELAAQLAASIWPELYDDLVWVVGEAINAQDDDASRQYWEAVYAALTQ